MIVTEICISMLIKAIVWTLIFYYIYKRWRRNLEVTWPYNSPGILFWPKTLLFYSIIQLRKRQDPLKTHNDSKAGYGSVSHSNLSDMEKPQNLQSHIMNIDAIFFSGASKDDWGVVLAMGRRPQGVTSVVVYIKVPGLGTLVPVQHPDCMYFRDKSLKDTFNAGGLVITPIESMKEWFLVYNGNMRKSHEPESEVARVQLELQWKSSLPHFDYNKDIPAWTLAKAFAREPWSKTFFQNLQKHHQSHYEQMGYLEGRVKLNGKTTNLKMAAFRDHSFGSRDWSLMHRYVFHHIFLENGSCGVFGVVCQPTTCTRLVVGHWWDCEGNMESVTDTDFELFNHGERGRPPTEYAVKFSLTDGSEKLMKVTVENSPFHYLDWDWEAKLFERWVKYEIDGVKGSGICEWHYNHKDGRDPRYTEKDPECTRKLRLQYLSRINS